MQYGRLKKNGDFTKLFKKGSRVYSPSLTFIYLPVSGRDKITRMGVALSKKHGKAVKRNRLKRQIRAAFSNNFALLPGVYDIVIMPKVADEYIYKDIERGVVSCIKRMKK